jgi:hypothetical protein
MITRKENYVHVVQQSLFFKCSRICVRQLLPSVDDPTSESSIDRFRLTPDTKLQVGVKSNSINFPNLEDLSLRTVCALPKDSKMGYV